MISAIESDNRHLEAYIILRREDLIDSDDFSDLLNLKHEWLKDLYNSIFNYKGTPIFSPFFMEEYSYECYKNQDVSNIFTIGTEMIEDFLKCSTSYLVLGYYHLSKKKYSESRKCFYEAIKYDKNVGNLWLLLGLSYSGLKECENSISCYNQARQFMIGSYKPDFYIGYEYHKMHNIEQANFFLERL